MAALPIPLGPLGGITSLAGEKTCETLNLKNLSSCKNFETLHNKLHSIGLR
jgi:hypothetical protein